MEFALLRILSITGGSSIAVFRRRLKKGNDLQAAAASGAELDVKKTRSSWVNALTWLGTLHRGTISLIHGRVCYIV